MKSLGPIDIQTLFIFQLMIKTKLLSFYRDMKAFDGHRYNTYQFPNTCIYISPNAVKNLS